MMTMMMMEMMMMTIMTTTIMMMMTTLMMMMVIMPTWREEEVVGEAVHAARVLHEVGRDSTIVVAHTSTVLLVPLSTTQRGVALL